MKGREDGSFVEYRKKDVLTAALQTPEHPGRVRCRGAYVTQTSVFGKQNKKHMRYEETSQLVAEYEGKIASLTSQLVERDRMYEKRFRELENRLKEQQQDVHSENQPSPSYIPTNGSGNTIFCSPVLHDPPHPSTPIHDPPHPCTADGLCNLLTEPDGPVVAEGQIIDTSSTVLHGRPLNPDHSRVSIIIVLDADALLPVPINEELETVGHALNTIVAWPKTLIWDANTEVIA